MYRPVVGLAIVHLDILKQGVGYLLQECHHVGERIVTPPGAFQFACQSFVGGQRTRHHLLLPETLLEHATVLRWRYDTTREEVEVFGTAYLLSCLVQSVHVYLLRTELHLGHRVGSVRFRDADIHVTAAVVMEGRRRGHHVPPLIVMAHVKPQFLHATHMTDEHGTTGTVGIDIVVIARCIQLDIESFGRKPVFLGFDMYHSLSLISLILGLRTSPIPRHCSQIPARREPSLQPEPDRAARW